MNSFNFKDNSNMENFLPTTEDSEATSSAKKRKISIGGSSSSSLTAIKLQMSQLENEKLSQLIEDMENEKRVYFEEHKKEMTKMEVRISMLQKENVDLKLKYNESSKVVTELNSNINVDAEKNKILEAKNQELESKIKELMEEVSTMKTVKSEIKDSVENERETIQESMEKMKSEINDLKNKNSVFEEINQKRLNTINLFILKTDKLQQQKEEDDKKIKTFEEALKSAKILIAAFQSKIDAMKGTIDNLQKKNTELMNDKNVLQNFYDKYKRKPEEAGKKNQPSLQEFSWYEVFGDDFKLNVPLLSGIAKKVLKISKTEAKKDGINFYSTTVESENPHSMSISDFSKTCFKMKIMDELIVQSCCNYFNKILPRIEQCSLSKLHLCNQQIKYDDFCKLVSFKKVEICILEKITILGDTLDFDVSDLLEKLPNIIEFQYEFRDNDKQSNVAQYLEKQLQPFSNLKKFCLLNLNHTFKLGEFSGFIKKNVKVRYSLKFRHLMLKSMQKEVENNEKVLIDSLKSLTSPCNISIEYNKI